MEQTSNLKELQNELENIKNNMVTKKEINMFLETLAIMSNENTMSQIQNSEVDIKNGKMEEINSLDEL